MRSERKVIFLVALNPRRRFPLPFFLSIPIRLALLLLLLILFLSLLPNFRKAAAPTSLLRFSPATLFLLSSLYLCHHLAPPFALSPLRPYFSSSSLLFLSRCEMCSSLVCSPRRLASVCPSHLTALLRSRLGRRVATPPSPLPPQPPAPTFTTASLHMVSSSIFLFFYLFFFELGRQTSQPL